MIEAIQTFASEACYGTQTFDQCREQVFECVTNNLDRANMEDVFQSCLSYMRRGFHELLG